MHSESGHSQSILSNIYPWAPKLEAPLILEVLHQKYCLLVGMFDDSSMMSNGWGHSESGMYQAMTISDIVVRLDYGGIGYPHNLVVPSSGDSFTIKKRRLPYKCLPPRLLFSHYHIFKMGSSHTVGFVHRPLTVETVEGRNLFVVLRLLTEVRRVCEERIKRTFRNVLKSVDGLDAVDGR